MNVSKRIFLFALLATTIPGYSAVTCVQPTAANAETLAQQAPAIAAVKKFMLDRELAPCTTTDLSSSCQIVANDLASLASAASAASKALNQCASSKSAVLTGEDRLWYTDRAKLWIDIATEQSNSRVPFALGTYTLPTSLAVALVGAPFATDYTPAPPTAQTAKKIDTAPAGPATAVTPMPAGTSTPGSAPTVVIATPVVASGTTPPAIAAATPQAAAASTTAPATPGVPSITKQPHTGESSLVVKVLAVPKGYSATLTPLSPSSPTAACDAKAAALHKPESVGGFAEGQVSLVMGLDLDNDLNSGDVVCVVENYTYTGADPKPVAPLTAAFSSPSTTTEANNAKVCDKYFPYNDCSWAYSAIGGVEQSDLSSQNSQTDGFVDLFVRGPLDTTKSLWADIRLLGAPNNSNTQNIGSAVTNPSGTVTSSALSTVGTSIDYIVGMELDPVKWRGHKGQYSAGLIAGFGATTPLTSQTATIAYAVPAYGTNECTQLQQRFGAGSSYNPQLPGSNGTTNCSFQLMDPKNPTAGGTQITNIAFAPQDRSSFLLKYIGGVRIIDRMSTTTDSLCKPTAIDSRVDTCERGIIDFTFGQDQAITGGVLRRMVFKSNFIFPIPHAGGIYVFGTADIRVEKNKYLSPLILTQTPISTSTGTPPAGSVTIPSANVFVLPLKQSDRDFYRVGIGFDLATIIPKLFGGK